MNTPIVDFVSWYSDMNPVRLHMPGHKGIGKTDMEKMDITEITGADSLYEANGIIDISENNASKLFCTGSTLYSAGGSSQSIKAMCLLFVLMSKRNGENKRPVIAAGRNVHKSFIQAAALIGFDIAWIPGEEEQYSLCSSKITNKGLERFLSELDFKPAAVYITTPDYLGNIADVKSLSFTSHKYGVPLICDNAHGAYLKFLPEDLHPITLGADACVDSAHKTLPVITGGGYLHISEDVDISKKDVRDAMSFFGSTSPSYLILESLDAANKWISESGKEAFNETVEKVAFLKWSLEMSGFKFIGDEPLKMTLDCIASGLPTGEYIMNHFREEGIECEYSDPDYIVLMWSPFNSDEDYARVRNAFLSIPHTCIEHEKLSFVLPEKVYTPSETLLMNKETIPVSEALGKVAGIPTVGCPPAVAPVVSGERINDESIKILKYYGINEISVIKD